MATLAALAVVTMLAGCAARGPIDRGAEDERITADVLRVLGEIEDVEIEDLRVETREGVVIISGVQSSLDVVAEILRRASRVRGVREVINQIRIIEPPKYEPAC